jgi:hypothetical protein
MRSLVWLLVVSVSLAFVAAGCEKKTESTGEGSTAPKGTGADARKGSAMPKIPD